MTKNIPVTRKITLALFICTVLIVPCLAENEHEGDWFSAETLSSVVKLSSLLEIYDVEGLPDDYTFRTKGGEPDFGNAELVAYRPELVSVGTGVLVTKSGLILSNAHVTRAYAVPEITTIQGPQNRVKIGSDGKPVKRVIVNAHPQCMYVGVVDVKRLAKGDDSQKLAYLAYTLADDADYDDNIRDRAVLQIIARTHINEKGIPIVDEKLSDLEIPCATLGNPFRTSFVDRKVRAMGFPGTGDPNRSARTSGELLGYENEDSSVILHTSYISNGNSGGGLFHKDNLIGINTWDNRKNPSRPIAEAQPVTYWYDMFAKVAWLYPSVNIPEVYLDWLDDDPSTEAYKTEVQLLLKIVSTSNKNVPVTKGTVYAHRAGTKIADIFAYKNTVKDLRKAWTLAQFLQYYTVDEVVEETGCNRVLAERLHSITKKEQLRSLLKPQLQPIFDEWMSDAFYFTGARLEDEDGKIALSVPKEQTLQITYVAADGVTYTSYTVDVDDDYIQGPYTLSVKQ